MGGQCAHFEPPFSFWCSQDDCYANAGHYTVPSGLRFKPQDLPHSPYRSAAGATITTWRPSRWANWAFEVGAQGPSGGRFAGSTTLNFSKGGFQGARGAGSGTQCERFDSNRCSLYFAVSLTAKRLAGFITNVPEELDAEREYWFNESDHSLLYVAADDKPPAASTFEHARVKQLFAVRGTQEQPVTDVILSPMRRCLQTVMSGT